MLSNIMLYQNVKSVFAAHVGDTGHDIQTEN